MTPPPGPSQDQAGVLERSADARLARLHLRGGLLALARASLEQMAGAGTLDRDAMADLAEARWRSGDLEGAAEAARAHQASGGGDPLAALIIAEDLMRSGQPADARRYAEYVGSRVGGATDQLFAREARSPLWPSQDDGWMPAGADAAGRFGLLVGGSEVAAPTPSTWSLEPLVPSTVGADPVADALIASTPTARSGGPSAGQLTTSSALVSGRLAGDELERVDRSLTAGDVASAGSRLSVLLRLDPALAPVILSTADRALARTRAPSPAMSILHLVRGDAYRILGRETEAAAAYRQAHQALASGADHGGTPVE
jgi:hypothetical protein